jgi:hypothetical protein
LASVPAKVYEYIGAAKNVLAIGSGQESLDLMRRGGCRVWAAGETDAAAICETLREIHSLHLAGGLTLEPGPGRLQFTQDAMAARLARILQDAIDSRKRLRAPQTHRRWAHLCPSNPEQTAAAPNRSEANVHTDDDATVAPAAQDEAVSAAK